MKIGSIAKWTSQSQGVESQKAGTVIAVVPKNTDGHAALKEIVGNIPKSRIKFQSFNMVYDRVIVAVPRSGQGRTTDFYAPNPKGVTFL